MSNYTAIEDVGMTIINLLWNKMKDQTDVIPSDSTENSIVLGSPGEIEDRENVRLSLFLYQVTENVHLKNQEMQQITSSRLRYPPLTLDLFYMLTSHSGTQNQQNRTERTREEHRRLGRAMQILHDNSILALEGSDADSMEELRITLNPMSLDDMTKIWTTFQGRSYRPSACYLVTPVKIDSERDNGVRRVVSKETDYDRMIPKREEE
jgi:hypothetical protein